MSSIVRGHLMRELLDHECVEDALREMECEYEKRGALIEIDESLRIRLTDTGALLEYDLQNSWQDQDLNSFIERLTKTYTVKLEERIERLKLEEARMKEDETLRLFAVEERKKKETELRRERMRLESVRRREEAALRRKIEEKAASIKQNAERLGYHIKEVIREKERVLVLVRR